MFIELMLLLFWLIVLVGGIVFFGALIVMISAVFIKMIWR